MSDVEYRAVGHVAEITIDRPERRNALSIAASEGIVEAVERADGDPDVRVVVISGAGDQAFCAGADLKELDEIARSGSQIPVPMRGAARNVFEAVLECRKPTIAAVNGAALAGGLELALACDLRVCVPDALLGLPEAKRGMGANFASVILPRIIPRAVALELLYTAEPIAVDHALRIGLLNHVYPRDAFRARTRAFADAIAANAPITLRRYKEMTVKGWELPIATALRLDAGPNPYTSADREEGVRAFVEKRAPEWRNR